MQYALFGVAKSLSWAQWQNKTMKSIRQLPLCSLAEFVKAVYRLLQLI